MEGKIRGPVFTDVSYNCGFLYIWWYVGVENILRTNMTQQRVAADKQNI